MPGVSIGPISKAVGVNIDQIRKMRGVSITWLGERIGLHRVGLTELIHGRRRVDVDELVALAAVLDVGVLHLLGLEELVVVVVPAMTQEVSE